MRRLLLLIALTAAPLASLAFDDVSPEFPYAEAIDYLQTAELVEGYETGEFRPQKRINRVEFVKILVGAAELELSECELPFSDTEASAWYVPHLCTAFENELIDGYPDGTFRPADPINFAESAKIMANALQLEGASGADWYAEYVNGLTDAGAIPLSITTVEQHLTRGEMAESIARIITEQSDLPTQTLEDLTAELPTFDSCNDLKDRVGQALAMNNTPTYWRGGRLDGGMADGPMMMPMIEPAMAPMMDASFESASVGASTGAMRSGGSNAKATEFSQTNVQVAGIDEPDKIKNNGEFIYRIVENEVQIVRAYPVTQLEIIGNIDMPKGLNLRQLLLEGDTLVVIGETYEGNQALTRVMTFNIANGATPQLMRNTELLGYAAQSRLKGGRVYTLLQSQMDVDNRYNTTIDLLALPQYRDLHAEQDDMQKLVECEQMQYIASNLHQAQFTTLVQLPVTTEQPVTARVVAGVGTDEVYMSHNALYASAPVWNWGRIADWNWNNDQAETNIYKFDITKPSMPLAGRGRVPGTIKNQFSLDEWNGNLRVATTTRSAQLSLPNVRMAQSTDTNNNMYVLDGTMQTVGSLENLAPGEQIHSTRFMGPLAYMVTFQQIDPLFVIDLQDPRTPRVLGELKIPGYSDYLHPLGDDHLIGFGKEAIANNSGGAFQQGLKVALFDVSDVNNPIMQDELVIGDRGSDTTLLWDHHALLTVPNENVFAFPVTRATLTDEQRENNTQGSQWGRANWIGAYVLQITPEDGIKELGTVSHIAATEFGEYGLQSGDAYQRVIERLVAMDDTLYAVSELVISAHELLSPDATINRIGPKAGAMHIEPGEWENVSSVPDVSALPMFDLEGEARIEGKRIGLRASWQPQAGAVWYDVYEFRKDTRGQATIHKQTENLYTSSGTYDNAGFDAGICYRQETTVIAMNADNEPIAAGVVSICEVGENAPDMITLETLEHLAADAQNCTQDSDCGAMPYGARACGGPEGYITAVLRDHVSSVRLFNSIQDYTEMRRQQIADNDEISTCEFIMPPAVACQQSRCVALTSPVL